MIFIVTVQKNGKYRLAVHVTGIFSTRLGLGLHSVNFSDLVLYLKNLRERCNIKMIDLTEYWLQVKFPLCQKIIPLSYKMERIYILLP
jgi:hypothetical protein